MSFAEKILETIRNVEESANSDASKGYQSVLNEMVSALTDLGVGARIATDQDRRIHALYIYPKYRPQRGSRMLRFFIDGDKIEVSGATSEQLASPEQLQVWLLNYVKLPSFITSLQELREMAKEPVEARLRVSKRIPFHTEDVMVEVSPSDQEVLGSASVGADIQFKVKRIAFKGNGTFGADKYEVLNSAGLLVDVLKLNDTDDAEIKEIMGKRSDKIEY